MRDDAPNLSAAPAPIRRALSLDGDPSRLERYYDTWADTYDEDPLTQPPPPEWEAAGDVVVCGGVYTLGHVAPDSLERILDWVRPGGVAVVSTRRAYSDTTDFQQVVDRLVDDGRVEVVSIRRDLPYTEDSTAHYWAFHVPG